ncbi:type II secretion system F family protein [Glaciibacter sp. 2TAF33]|uniref:type II secretion system F family protein n=1 Tax=Glaciibacter sp. 2TAF33 TaxID=3233015 RepID=UPI003F914CAC
MSEAAAWAVFCGTTLGLGLWSLVSITPRLSRPRLVDRVAPYILDVSAEARAFVGRRTVDPIPVLGALFAPVVGRVTRAFAEVVGGADTIKRRLHQSGSSKSVEQFRSEQLVVGLVALVVGASVVVLLPSIHDLPVGVQLLLPLVAGLAGALLRDWVLQRAARARLARMSSELPTILEFLTLSLSAGEGILDSLGRVAVTSSGEVSREFAGVLAEVHTGVPLAVALNELAQRIQLAPLTRCLDQITGALERGSPLAEVLRAQAQDARDESKRALLELAGKKEVAMLVPLVFLILPMTVVFAIFPGIFVLQSGF